MFLPRPGSPAAALIAGDALNARAMTGREYHYPHCRSSPCQEQPDFICLPGTALCQKRYLTGLRVVTEGLTFVKKTMGMCLMNEYLIFKVQTYFLLCNRFYVLECSAVVQFKNR